MIPKTSKGIDAMHILHRLHLPECSARYHREELAQVEIDRIRAERERLGRNLAWFAIGLVVLAFTAGIFVDAWAWVAQS